MIPNNIKKNIVFFFYSYLLSLPFFLSLLFFFFLLLTKHRLIDIIRIKILLITILFTLCRCCILSLYFYFYFIITKVVFSRFHTDCMFNLLELFLCGVRGENSTIDLKFSINYNVVFERVTCVFDNK